MSDQPMNDSPRSEEELCNEVVHRRNRGESKRRIGMQLGISRWKVTEILRRYHLGRDVQPGPNAQSNGDSLPQGKTPEPIPPSLGRPSAKRVSKLDAFEPQLRQLIERYPNITNVRLYEEIKASGYSGRYSILAERVRQLRDRPTKPLTVRFETGPGVRASELLLSRIRELVAARATFSFETTLAARSYQASIIEWRRLGYRVVLYFIWLPSPELAIQRVAKRVREGGHNILEAVVRRRYARGLSNLFDLYIPIVTTVCVYDGASFPPIPIAEIEGERKLVLDYNGWERVQLHRKDAPSD